METMRFGWTKTVVIFAAVAWLAAGCGGDGKTCGPDTCNGHGDCDDAGGDIVCTCDPGYTGDRCDSCADGYHPDGEDCVADSLCAVSGLDCGAHGHCDDSSGLALCVCDTGYAGERCGACAAGYHDDGSGTCVEDGSVCGPDTCNGHGSCDDASGTAVCTCDPGYAGNRCQTCADGYHDGGSGTCVEDTACGPDSCSGHGTCDDASGTAVCTCDTGYAGEACDSCAAGYHDDGSGTCIADTTCGPDTCNGHGSCDDSSGTPVCTCDTGYVGDHCDSCADGYHDDGSGTCVEDVACGPDSCSGHGTCDDASGTPVCTCDTGYTGEACEACDTGYQDNDDDGSCLPDCDTAGMDCGAHGDCDDAGGEAGCVCDTGYAGALCDTCAAGYHDDGSGTCVEDTSCGPDTCSGHGECDDASGTPVCTCDTGYAGPHCESCTTGYQDNDGDGTCLPDCDSAGLDCGAHGSCDDSSGEAMCACDTGYTGDACDACAAGHQDNDGDGSCLPDCDTAGLGCSGHGQCDDSSGEAACVCDTGYTGDACDTCATGYQDNDTDGTCLPDCDEAGLDCGPHGACDDTSGEAECSCDAGYTGDACDACAAGFQDNDADGTCLPDCDTAGLNCGPHGACDDASGEAVCVCDTGYAGDACDTCAAGYQDNDGDGSCLADCTTAGLTCSGHGQCDDSTGAAVCVCDTGYTGDDCDTCATGYQDNDGDGTCLANCTTSGLDCGAHGDCSDSSGEAVCVCDTGYAGAACDSCAAGYQDNDGNGSCLPNCQTAGLSCPEHAHCDDGSGEAECVCDTGYSGAGCDTCVTGYQDNDGDGTCLADCTTTGLDCGDHGYCDDSGGVATCDCDTGYTGSSCQFCAAGYQDNDGDGLCLADCDTAGLDCGDHGHCEDESGEALCECNTGYTGADCSACATGYQDNDNDGTCLATCATAGYTCSGHGYCDDSGGTAECVCDAGFEPDGAGNCLPASSGYTCADPIALDLSQGTVSGNTEGTGNEYFGACRDNTDEELVYVFTIVEQLDIVFESTGFDTVLYLRSDCDDIDTEIDCNDDSPPGLGSQLDVSLDPGTYYLFVDGYGTNSGTFELTIDVGCPDGTVYDPGTGECVDDPCDPNPCTQEHQTVCQVILPDSFECHCDPGYIPDPEDPDICILDPNPTGETCAGPLPLTPGEGTESGTTSDAADDGRGTCAGDGPDRIYAFSIAEVNRVELLMTGYDTVLHVRTVCDDQASEVACNDDGGSGTNAEIVTFLDPGTYYLWADSYSSGGNYELSYSFRTDPCAVDPCPGTPECVASADWSTFECVCPEGTIPYDDDCVDDPCEPNPCTSVEHMNKCVVDLPDGYHCECNVGYIPDGQGGCMLDPDANEWAFYVFLNADNNLNDAGVTDVDEMSVAGSTPYVHIVALFDRYSDPADIIYVTEGGYDVVESWGEVNMSDPQTLEDFGVWAVQNYPARHHALIMWDHGAGWKYDEPKQPLIKGFSNDDHPGGGEISISNGEYASAMAGITAELGAKLDIVGFDACLMGMWEVAEASAPYANYLVASSETEPFDGWPYDDFLVPLINDPGMTAADLGISIVDAYYNESTSNDTLAVTHLDTMGDLEVAMSAFADALLAHPELYGDIESIRQATQDFYYYDDFRDLQDFAERIQDMSSVTSDIATAAADLVAQLEISIVYSRAHSGHPGSNGLAIYFPSHGGGMDAAYTDSGAVWSQNTTWDEFLQDFTQ